MYDQWNNNWVTIADINNHDQGYFIIGLPGMSVGKIRYTFYETVQNDNLLGLSELFFIHPESAQAYDNLLLRYNELGNVGIGTATPKEKLAVNGSIRAHEIKVEATNWPDYVFDKDYNLLPLKELENYVKINKHLPDMPKADAVEKDGVHLGEMINKLLKKNEELTLYILSLQNQIDEILKNK
ncbi:MULTISPECIES: hypothetical protein [Sphingobacterium]|uniref:hypothetical protein n=1 Tax=Sphingobacterium TaxID=28453 RepID=UPI00257D9351|nr:MULTISPECIES: hypothetical protein [Sphingobacterium]